MKTEITIRSGRLHVQTPYSAALVDRFRAIPDRRFHDDSKTWSFPVIRDVVLMVIDAVGVMPWSLPDELRGIMEPENEIAQVPVEMRYMEDLNEHSFKTKPFDHQRRNLARLWQEDRWLLADEQGCIHPHTMLKCEESGKKQTVESWHIGKTMPLLPAYDKAGEIVAKRPSRIFIKKFDTYLKITLCDGRQTIVAPDHKFLVKIDGSICLRLAKNLPTYCLLATRLGINGPENTDGTQDSLRVLSQNNKHTGSVSSWATDLFIFKEETSNSKSRSQSKTLIISNSSLKTYLSTVLRYVTDKHASSIYSAMNSGQHFNISEWIQEGKGTELFHACEKNSCRTSGGEYSTPTVALLNNCNAKRQFTRLFRLLYVTLLSHSCKCLLKSYLSAGSPMSKYFADTKRGQYVPLDEELLSGALTGCIEMLPGFYPGKPESSERPGLTELAEACEHVIPASCRNLSFQRILKIEKLPPGPIYDLTMDGLGNYFDASGINHQNTGKSHAICNRLKTMPLDYDVLIICPKSCQSGWKEQLYIHANIDGIVVDGTPMHRVKQLTECFPRLKIVNYELLIHSYEAIAGTKWDVIIFDEIHRVKTWTARTSKVAREISVNAKHVYGLSGTPAPNGLEDWFGVLGAIKPGLLPVSTKSAFEARYCVKTEIQPHVWKVSGYRNVAELHRYIASVTSRVTKAECLDLPPKLFESRRVALEGEQARIYRDLKNKAVANLLKAKEEKTLTIRNVLTESLRLLQLVGGFVPSDDGDVTELKDKAKLPALADVLDEAGGKQVVVWCCFRPEVKMLTKWLEKNYGPTCNLLGGMDQEDRWENLERFKSGEARYFVGTAAAGGTGVNQLVVADTAVYYSRDFNFATWSQSQDRVHRIGTKNAVTIIKLLASGTIDHKVDAALDKKESMLEMMLDNPKEIG